MQGRDTSNLADDQSTSAGFCLTGLSTRALTVSAGAVSALIWLLILAVL